MCLPWCQRPRCGCRGGGGRGRRVQAEMLLAGPRAWPRRTCMTRELLVEYVMDADKGLRMLFGHGGCIWHCGGRGGLVVVGAAVWRCRAASTTPAPLPSHDHQGSRLDLLYTLRAREGATTHQGAFGMTRARSSYCSLPKATLSASTGRM